MKEKRKIAFTSLPASLFDEAKEIAKKESRTLSNLIRYAIQVYLAKAKEKK